MPDYNPSDDAYVHSGNPGVNYGAETLLRVRNWSGSMYTFLMFDLTSLDCEVEDADLILVVDGSNDYEPTSIISLHEVDADIDEGTLTWNNKPALGLEVDTQNVGGGGGAIHTYSSALLTAYVDAEQGGNCTLGLKIKSGWGRQRYRSKEYNGDDPILRVTCGEEPEPEVEEEEEVTGRFPIKFPFKQRYSDKAVMNVKIFYPVRSFQVSLLPESVKGNIVNQPFKPSPLPLKPIGTWQAKMRMIKRILEM